MKNILLACALLSVACESNAGTDGVFHLVAPITLGAASKYDYTAFDAQYQRLFVTRGDHVDVVDVASGKIVGAVSDTAGVHGVAFAAELGLGFTSNGKSDSVTVFNLQSFKKTTEIKLKGKNPDALVYDPSVQKLLVFNGKSANYEVIDARTLKVIAEGAASGKPEFAVVDGHGKVFVNIEDHAGIDVIDVKSNKVIAKWTLEGCNEPTGLAIDVENGRLFSSCQNRIMAVTDTKTGKRVADFAIGEHPDAVIFDPATQMVYASGGGGNGTLSIAHQDDASHYTVLPSITTEKGARTMAMDMRTKTVYVPSVVADKFVIVRVARTQ